MGASLTQSPKDEKESIEEHRRYFFREILGKDVPNDDIEQLVHSNVSPHEAKKLKDAGCAVDIIIKILL